MRRAFFLARFSSVPQSPNFVPMHPNLSALSRRAFLKASALTATAPLLSRWQVAAASRGESSIIASVGTYSSPLHDPKPTQVDRPAGNGHRIHLFRADPATGGFTAYDVFELPTSTSCLALN